MSTFELVVIGGLGIVVLFTFICTIYRLTIEPRTGLDERSTRLARLFFNPNLFDPLLAKPLTKREKIGWLIVLLVVICIPAFSYLIGVAFPG